MAEEIDSQIPTDSPTGLPASAGSALPLPKALYSCKYCAEEYSWPADDLNWSSVVSGWVCNNCWCGDDHGDPGIRLDRELALRMEGHELLARELMRVCYDEANRLANHGSNGLEKLVMSQLYDAANAAKKKLNDKHQATASEKLS
jgi:hypothetical protein